METPKKTSSRVRGVIKGLNETARVLRHDLTPAERVLWNALRGRKLANLKFRRQYPVGRYVLDFYCAEHRLALELDGGAHEAQRAHDAERTRILNEFNIRVLRFSNIEVTAKLPHVLNTIREAANSQSPSPLPRIGRGAGGEGR